MKVAVEIPVAAEAAYQPEVIKNIYWVDPNILAARYDDHDDSVIHIEYGGRRLSETTCSRIREAAAHVIESISRSPIQRSFDQTDLPVPFGNDPLPELETAGAVRELFAGGSAYSGLFLKLMNGLDRAFLAYAGSLCSEELAFPGMLSLDSAMRCHYLENYPQNVNLVSHVHEDLSSLRAFRQVVQEGSGAASEQLDSPDLVLSPNICYHFWQSLADREHGFDGLKTGTAVGSCHRYESRATTGLERLREFRMREIFAIGEKSNVLDFRDMLLAGQKDFLQKFELAGCIETASDPFFVDTSQKRIYQLSLNLKHEIKALLPYKNELLAISSVNYHENFFSKAFNIRSRDGEVLHSCCLGFGLDRWCLAVFAQFGLDTRKWPRPVRELID